MKSTSGWNSPNVGATNSSGFSALGGGYRGNYPAWVPFLGGQDFLFFRPVFNIADSAITTGVLAIIIFQKSLFKKTV